MHKVYDFGIEELVIRKFFEDSVIQHKIASNLDEDYFDDKDNKKICDWIIRFHKAYSRYPGAQELITALPKCIQRQKLIDVCNATLQPMERPFVIDQIEKFFRERKTKLILSNTAEAIHNKDFSNISELVKELQTTVNFSLSMDIGLHIVNDAETAMNRLNESMRAIPCALSDVRAFTSNGDGYGGFYRKALTIYMGMPNVGKTIMLCNDAAFAYQKGYNVLYITLEMAEELIWERISANITDINMKNFRKSETNTIKHLLTKTPDGNEYGVGELIVKSLPTTSTVIDIDNEIIEIKRNLDIDIDLLIVDYIGIMKPSKRLNSINNHTLYTMGKEIAEQLRDLAKFREIAVVTASQLNRDGYSAKEASMQNVAGSAGLNDTADLMITITQDDILRQHCLFYHMILKNRFGKNMVNTISKVDYSHMRVRTATDEDYQEYSNSQISQGSKVDNFTSKNDDFRGSDNAPSKKMLEIQEQINKQLENKNIKTNKQKETILDSNVIDEHPF